MQNSTCGESYEGPWSRLARCGRPSGRGHIILFEIDEPPDAADRIQRQKMCGIAILNALFSMWLWEWRAGWLKSKEFLDSPRAVASLAESLVWNEVALSQWWRDASIAASPAGARLGYFMPFAYFPAAGGEVGFLSFGGTRAIEVVMGFARSIADAAVDAARHVWPGAGVRQEPELFPCQRLPHEKLARWAGRFHRLLAAIEPSPDRMEKWRYERESDCLLARLMLEGEKLLEGELLSAKPAHHEMPPRRSVDADVLARMKAAIRQQSGKTSKELAKEQRITRSTMDANYSPALKAGGFELRRGEGWFPLRK
ncbi:MAG TPA: hypothetical protein VH253_11005 [Phycisphaerae bacterium]|nr:hypothetical protein [Phycisphaerae bacterium]